MSRTAIARYVTPWKYRRELEALRRVAELRRRDGDHCARCKRPLRFDLPDGHDQGPKIEHILSANANAAQALDNCCLTHGRCNAEAGDMTAAVRERLRLQREAALFARPEQRA